MTLTVLRDDPYNSPEPALMEFRLTYQGLLLGAKQSRPDHKHEIRKVFHKQLARLWQVHPVLTHMSIMKGSYLDAHKWIPKERWNKGVTANLEVGIRGTEDQWLHFGGITAPEILGYRYARGAYKFVPLVREELNLITSIHVLFLRPEPPGSVLSSGDIDGRIKTLFDSLKIPKETGETGKYDKPDTDENPFFCLVEDDQFISHVSVETDTLLEPISGNRNDARLVITVKIRPYAFNSGNVGFS